MNPAPPTTESLLLDTPQRREGVLLVPYAVHSSDSAGREHEEPPHLYRNPYQRDRDRILHCAAFRRLGGKMQVFTGERGDYHRTRLTHTLEVSSIARTLGRTLRLNEDLIEALTLIHDLGHPPFGHSGEAVLNECLAEEGGFSHNRHALTIVQQIERRYPHYPGLNLTCEVLAGQAWRAGSRKGQSPPLEVQVVDLADSISYDAHDTDDAVKLGLITIEQIREIPLIREAILFVEKKYGILEGKPLRKAIVHELIDRQVGDVLREGAQMLRQAAPASAADAIRMELRLRPSGLLDEQKQEFEAFLYHRVYRHPDIIKRRDEVSDRIRRLFDHFARRPDRLPPHFAKHAEQVGSRRATAWFLAGMTDRYCNAMHQEIFAGPSGPSP